MIHANHARWKNMTVKIVFFDKQKKNQIKIVCVYGGGLNFRIAANDL